MKSFFLILGLSLVLSPFSLAADYDGEWMVRVRSITMNPSESGTPTIVGGDATLSNDSVAEIDFTYFFTSNFALELVVATTTHAVAVNGASNNTSNLDLGNISMLPPTLLAQYHLPLKGWKPYVGAGLNYTFFYDATNGDMKSVTYEDSLGFAFQVGADIEMKNGFYLNADVKKVILSTDLEATTFTPTTVTADVTLDPWIFALGLGYRF